MIPRSSSRIQPSGMEAHGYSDRRTGKIIEVTWALGAFAYRPHPIATSSFFERQA